ncbi:MAG: HlyD family efflux transporter periplasmic adaptor subunit [Porphyromonadaceae bacterium]|nr:MAG: HlyD family efflux transporter periplasmic adaptor subunit [Porphyromonadaceae bacterium]
MTKKSNIEIHNEEVREIMGEIPGLIIKWGLTVVFSIIFIIIVGSYFFKYPKVVSAPMTIITSNPPASLISKSSGRIASWFIHDGQMVNQGDKVAIIKNTAEYEDVLYLSGLLNNIDTTNIKAWITKVQLPEKLVLGELQSPYNLFSRNWYSYYSYLKNDYLSNKINLAEKQLVRQEEQYQMLLEQKKILEAELKIEEKTFARQQNLVTKGGVSDSQMDEANARLLQAQRTFIGFKSSLVTAEINLLNQRQSIIELHEQHLKNIEQLEQDIFDSLRSLLNQINTWQDKYLITSPIDGEVTLTDFWSENQVINAGERLATVVPADHSKIICKAYISHAGVGEIKLGQDVKIKLSGFPYMQYGMLFGKVKSVSLVPEEKGYVVVIDLLEGMKSSYSEVLELVQEMNGTAEIVTQNTRAIYRFIEPLRLLFE